MRSLAGRLMRLLLAIFPIIVHVSLRDSTDRTMQMQRDSSFCQNHEQKDVFLFSLGPEPNAHKFCKFPFWLSFTIHRRWSMKSCVTTSTLLVTRMIHGEVTMLRDMVVHVLHGKLEMKESERANKNE